MIFNAIGNTGKLLKMRVLMAILLLEGFFIKVQCDSLPSIIRQTQNGPVEGIKLLSAINQSYHAFFGIPYAEPPITGADPYTGEQIDNRFKAPKSLQRNWTAPLRAYESRKDCTPSDNDADLKLTSEDCLWLNIFVPVGGSKKKTVLVWIHGGGYRKGSAGHLLYGPEFLLTQDNIVVLISYRLGMFGFLNLGYGDYTGNMGLKDQQLAMKWTYENIEQFSGNKDEILLFGESAGGSSVHYHMLNMESRKYFQRAFAASGSAMNYFVLRKENHYEQVRMCARTSDTDQMLKYLKTAGMIELGSCCMRGYYPDGDKYPIWIPTIEKANTRGAFLTRTPQDIYDSHSAPAVDAMFGFNSHEAIQFRSDLLKKRYAIIDADLKENSLFRLPFDGFSQFEYPEKYKWAMEKLVEAYFPNKSSVEAVKQGNIALISDYFVGQNVLKAVVLQTKANNKIQRKNTFFFRLSVWTSINLNTRMLGGTRYNGAAHMDDLCYMF